MKRLAFLLGTEKYKEFGPTHFCHADVNLLRNTLIDYCGFAEQDVIHKLLTPDDDVKPITILNELKYLVDKSSDGDTILFYYAGHGTFYNGDSYLILPNTARDNKEQTALPLRDISNLLREKSRTNIRVFDSCHSGQDVRAEQLEELDYNAFTRDILSGSAEGWITFASCREDEVSYGDPKLQQGVFTYYLAESIREFGEDEKIYPEILKIKVCEKVAKWCVDNQKSQTPTYNAALSGNVSIAVRKKLVRETNTPVVDQIPSNVNVRSVEERLLELKKFERIGNEQHKEALANYIAKAKESVVLRFNEKPLFGVVPEISDIVEADEIPNDIKPLITRVISSKDLRTLHDVEIIRHYEKKNNFNPVVPFSESLSKAFSSIGKLLYQETEPKVISVTHKISQDILWPNSYFELEIESDGYIPNGKIFVYIVPLLVTACLISGIAVDYDDESALDMKKTTLDPVFLKFDAQDSELIENQINLLVDTFIRTYSEITLKRLEYLEWEISQK